MKTVALLLALCLTACASETDYGRCIGAFDEPEPGLVYEVSVRNVVLACVFFQTLFAPIIVVAKEVRCPVGKRATAKGI